MKNTTLPPMPAWHARSFYATLLAAITLALNAFGVDFLGWTCDLGVACKETVLLDKIEAVVPVLFLIWTWVERRAPNFRLVWSRLRSN